MYKEFLRISVHIDRFQRLREYYKGFSNRFECAVQLKKFKILVKFDEFNLKKLITSFQGLTTHYDSWPTHTEVFIELKRQQSKFFVVSTSSLTFCTGRKILTLLSKIEMAYR